MKYSILIWVCFLLWGCSTYPQALSLKTQNSPAKSSYEIYIVNHGWHTGIIAPAHNVNIALPQLKLRFPEAQWYEIGWGDKGFYQAHEITTKLTLQAMFWSSGAVLHVVTFSQKPSRYFSGEDISELTLDSSQFNNLMRFIGRSFAYDDNRNLIPLKYGIYGNSQFYAANGRYSIFNTCNKWTAKALVSAGMDIDPTFKLTSSSVMQAIKDNSGCLNRYCYLLDRYRNTDTYFAQKNDLSGEH
ncbi:TIGR02117 family protein [Citrobacter werkmanii]|uniref:TIGR02117 family protein n=1 Tax=Citrobacter werkmanii TaxID=67827 RepID=A0AA37ZBH8_9ENTR|nr:TIGR02117 family protein [Citrobacter werkmanii]EGT0641866.1 TIGR02117 family protein [Citrobacter werkmanii]EGT0673205.1 TIGR02117 family protein [Citrobacter werkmanii]MEC3946134.1 TIGR02117 family protein [Citrobacter werkmanii]HAT7594651.1 TIGR02117 family protein [Citrobacter werkmanii]HCL5538474.1 TIGR02117 family protein [Citrobacter werkmanii]